MNKQLIKSILTFSIGAGVGYIYYSYTSCSTGTCPLNSNPLIPMILFGFVGLSLFSNNFFGKNKNMIDYQDIIDRDKDTTFLVDVRSLSEFESGTINGAININVNNIKNKIDKFPKDKKIFIFCAVGVRGSVACSILKKQGYDAYNLRGGIKRFSRYAKI